MDTAQAALDALDRRAWQARFVSRSGLRSAVDAMLRLAPPGSPAAAKAHFHLAVSHWQANLHAESELARRHAEELFARHDHAAGLANCRDLEAQVARIAGHHAYALDLYRINRALPDAARTAAEHCVTCAGEGAVYMVTGEHDACQRVWSIAVSLAQRADNPGLEVSALSNLAAWNIGVCNFEDGRQLSQRAVDLADQTFDLSHPEDMMGSWFSSGMNLLVALDSLGRHTEARSVAARLLALQTHFSPSQRANYFVSFASAYLHAGEIDDAERFLHRSIETGGATPEFALEQSIVQAEIWNQRGQFAETKALCQKLMNDAPAALRGISAYDLMRFHNAATAANEAQGDYANGLLHQKIAFEKYEELVGTSARARRLTLEIRAELQRTEWQRDQALKHRIAAEAEQRRLAELNTALQAANTAKSGFLAAASHDLRQPIHAVSLLADTLATRLSEPIQRELVARIQHSTTALQRLLNELLDISELDAGATIAEMTHFPVGELLLNLDNEFRGVANSRNLQLRLAAIDVWTTSDRGHLLQIMRILLVNALNHTVRGGVLIAVRSRRGSVMLEVWDTGVGIAAEHLPRLFEPFYQVGNRARDRRKGFGLGLAIASRLANLLGHSLEVHSRPGRGTVARLILPSTTHEHY